MKIRFNQKTLFLVLFLFLSFLTVWLFFRKSRLERIVTAVPPPEIVRLNASPEFLADLPEGLHDILEFYRHSPHLDARQKLVQQYHSEKGNALYQIYLLYLDYMEAEKIVMSGQQSGYEKLLKISKIREKMFGTGLARRIYPEKNSDKVRLYYAWADDYIDKNPGNPDDIFRHIAEKKGELPPDTIFSKEDERLLVAKAYRRRLGILTPEQKERFVRAKLNDFGW